MAKKERLIELLEEKRTALITRAVTKGLDPNAPMKDSGVEWLGEIPAHWEVRSVEARLRDESRTYAETDSIRYTAMNGAIFRGLQTVQIRTSAEVDVRCEDDSARRSAKYAKS